MNIIAKRKYFFILSLLVIIPGLLSLVFYGLTLAIDFSGGSRFEIQNKNFNSPAVKLEESGIIVQTGASMSSIQQSGQNIYIIRTKPVNQKIHNKILSSLNNQFGGVKEISFETVGPTIGSETTTNAFKSVIVAALLIIIYIAWSFRKVPKPASSWRFGICAIIALIHDVLVVVGIFSILGHFFGVEIDSLFVTALLTVIGFSVHDTIVVFDRIRENLRRTIGLPFGQVVNDSILQTLTRSLNTSLTALLVLFTLLLFGGDSIHWFVVALLVGLTSGT